MERKGFTLAEVLITLAIIGVVAALTIPSVIVNAREQANVTAFKKAISVLNSAISLNDAIDGNSPSATSSSTALLEQLSNKMNVISVSTADEAGISAGAAISSGVYFTTADGMQFAFPNAGAPTVSITLAKDTCSNKTLSGKDACTAGGASWVTAGSKITAKTTYGACTDTDPCIIVVDVNGAQGPNNFSTNVNSAEGSIADRFPVMITSDGAMPAGEQAAAVMAK